MPPECSGGIFAVFGFGLAVAVKPFAVFVAVVVAVEAGIEAAGDDHVGEEDYLDFCIFVKLLIHLSFPP